MDFIFCSAGILLFALVLLLSLFLAVRLKVTRSGLLLFCFSGLALGCIRIAVFVLYSYLQSQHSINEWMWLLGWAYRILLLPETCVFPYLSPDLELTSVGLVYAWFSFQVLIGSYLWSMPTLYFKAAKKTQGEN